MEKEEFVCKYLNSSKKLKNHNLPYGMEYLNLLAEEEEAAEKKWEKHKVNIKDIETVSDLVEQISDWIGVYGCCKGECDFSDKNIMCCRVGFTMHLEERIKEAVENDKLLEKRNLESLIKKKGLLNVSNEFKVK
jgi:hypothetical protein